MDEKKFFVDRRFKRVFLLTAAWLLLGPGLFFLFVSTAKLVGILFTFSGLGILGLGAIGRITAIISAAGMLITGFVAAMYQYIFKYLPQINNLQKQFEAIDLVRP